MHLILNNLKRGLVNVFLFMLDLYPMCYFLSCAILKAAIPLLYIFYIVLFTCNCILLWNEFIIYLGDIQLYLLPSGLYILPWTYSVLGPSSRAQFVTTLTSFSPSLFYSLLLFRLPKLPTFQGKLPIFLTKQGYLNTFNNLPPP